MPGTHVITCTHLIAKSGKEARRHAFAKNLREQSGNRRTLVLGSVSAKGHDHVTLVSLLLVHGEAGCALFLFPPKLAKLLAFRYVFEILPHGFENHLLGDIARHDNNGFICDIVCSPVLDEVFAPELLDILARPNNRPARRRIAIDKSLEHLPDIALWQILVHGNLLEYDSSLLLQVSLRQDRIEIKIGDNFKKFGEMPLGRLGVIAGIFVAGEGIVLGSQGIELLGYHACPGPKCRAFETHMLEEVREPVLILGFVI